MHIPAFTYAPILHDWLEDQGLDGKLSEPPLAYPYFGHGYGDGYGSGYGYGHGQHPQPKEKTMPVVGERMLIFCGLSFAFCADVVDQTGPYTFRLKDASMLCNTGGVPWDELADGKRREAATFRYQGDIHCGPFFSWSREWKGELPSKNNKCKNVGKEK